MMGPTVANEREGMAMRSDRPAPVRRVEPRQWIAAFLAAFLPLIVLSGCGLFSLRNPEIPTEPGIPRHVPNDPDSVMFNLTSGMEHKQTGVSLVRETLADTFSFELDITVARQAYGTTPVLLTRAETENGWLVFLNQVLGSDAATSDPVLMEFDVGSSHREDNGDNVRYDRLPYLLTSRTAAGAPKDTLAAGLVDLHFSRQSTGNWAISRWIDTMPTPQIPSLSSRIDPGSGHHQ